MNSLLLVYIYLLCAVCAGELFTRRWSGTRVYSKGFSGYQAPETKRGAFEIAKNSRLKPPVIILVNPFLDQNIGSVARAMLNFGLTELRIVDPNCDHLSENCRALAAGAYEILENAKVYNNLTSCVEDMQRVLATTVRPRYMSQIVYTPETAARTCVELNSEISVGILFGRERSGKNMIVLCSFQNGT